MTNKLRILMDAKLIDDNGKTIPDNEWAGITILDDKEHCFEIVDGKLRTMAHCLARTLEKNHVIKTRKGAEWKQDGCLHADDCDCDYCSARMGA